MILDFTIGFPVKAN